MSPSVLFFCLQLWVLLSITSLSKLTSSFNWLDTNPIFILRLMGYTQELIVACRLLAEFLLLDNLSLSCMVKRECNGILIFILYNLNIFASQTSLMFSALSQMLVLVFSTFSFTCKILFFYLFWKSILVAFLENQFFHKLKINFWGKVLFEAVPFIQKKRVRID